MSDCGVGELVAEVDAEGGQRRAPVVGVAPLALGAGDGQEQQLAGGVLVGEAAAGLDVLADLAVQGFDRVGNRYERRQMLPVPSDRLGRQGASGAVSTVRPSGTGASGSR